MVTKSGCASAKPSANEQHGPLPDESLLNQLFRSGRLGSWASAGEQSRRKIRTIRIITVDRLRSLKGYIRAEAAPFFGSMLTGLGRGPEPAPLPVTVSTALRARPAAGDCASCAIGAGASRFASALQNLSDRNCDRVGERAGWRRFVGIVIPDERLRQVWRVLIVEKRLEVPAQCGDAGDTWWRGVDQI